MVVVVEPSGAVVVTVLVTVLAEELPLAPPAEPLLSDDAADEEEDAEADPLLDAAPPPCNRELSETVMLVPDEMLVMAMIPQGMEWARGAAPQHGRRPG
jgi:hypothetical protein